MAKIVVIGAGFAGHTAALYLGDILGKKHTVTMVNRHDSFAYIPSGIWVVVGHMKPEKRTFKLASVYKRMNVYFIHGVATKVHPDEGQQFVEVNKANGDSVRVEYDYLLVATGAKLNKSGRAERGKSIQYIGKEKLNISEKIVNKNGFVLVGGVDGLSYDELENNPGAWPLAYQNTNYKNIFAAGSALGLPISHDERPIRTSALSSHIGQVVALNIIDLVKDGQISDPEEIPEILTPPMKTGPSHLWKRRIFPKTLFWKLRGLPGWKSINI